ncbi:MAG: hypothetical protein HOE69_07620 [Euryarchaeota archaeon]|jgi:hypothetical protein|nr:hypothetical protein [Euryarchaeota archaeon]
MRVCLTEIHAWPRVVALALFFLLLTPLISPVAAEWEEDSWLVNIIGPERLAMGDEFGCHGIPDKDVRIEQEAIKECRDYLTQRTNASKWGGEPLSFGLPDGDVESITIDAVRSQNFLAIGHNELESVAYPEMRMFNFSGGSLEKSIGSVTQFNEAKNSGAEIINLYWQARNHDVVVRPDSELVSAIESTEAWFTTWGEYTSYHLIQKEFVSSDIGNETISVEFEPYSEISQAWYVPTTNVLTGFSGDVVMVYGDSGMLIELDAEEPHLQEGWRQEGDSLFLTLMPNNPVFVQFDANPSFNSTSIEKAGFNGHDVAITVTGIHTDDLFDWSRRWDDTPMRFTWLVEPREVLQFGWFLPTIAVLLALAAPVGIIWLVKNDRRAQQAVSVLNSLDNLSFAEE